MKLLVAVLVMSLSCGTERTGGGGDDVQPTIDAPLKTPGTPLTVNCQPYKRTVTAANGTRNELTTRFAVFDEVAIGDAFRITYCEPVTAASCPVGATCTGLGRPDGQKCYSNDVGQFLGGKLAVYCGVTSEDFNAAGTLTSSTTTNYENITVTKL